MSDDAAAVMRDVHALVDEYRARCLWYLREDWYPTTPEEAVRTLEAIEKHGDVPAFRRAAALRQWFSRNSSVPSAG